MHSVGIACAANRPGNSQAQELKQQASEALVRRRKVAELLAAARGFHKAQNYESACQVCAEGLALDPAHAELRLIQQQSQQVLERQTQIREWLKQAQERLQAGDYLAVLATTDQLLTLEPDLPRALEMQQQAAEALERQLKLEELVAEARGCEMAGDFEECLRVCDHALQISPENPEILSLCERASQTLAKQRRVAELLSRGRQEIERTRICAGNGNLSGSHWLGPRQPDGSRAAANGRSGPSPAAAGCGIVRFGAIAPTPAQFPGLSRCRQ